MPEFRLSSKYQPAGDQPKAIRSLVEGISRGDREQTLLGVTGSGKTFTMANIVQQLQRPTLVLSHNKTLAAQLYAEFKQFFPDNAVQYFVSYYDYYQPEAYIARSDTFIEKDSAINEEIDRLRHAATMSLLTRRDVLIVASVSCIYGLGNVSDYTAMTVELKVGERRLRDKLLRQLNDIQYKRNDTSFERGVGLRLPRTLYQFAVSRDSESSCLSAPDAGDASAHPQTGRHANPCAGVPKNSWCK